MSYSPQSSDDDSIRAMLRRLDANPRFDEDFRPDPLQVLREARMKVAASALETGGESENEVAADAAIVLGPPEAGPSSPIDDVIQTAILLPATLPADGKPEQDNGDGALMVIDAEAVEVEPPKVWKRRLLMAGAGIAVCSALAVGVAQVFPGASDTADVKLASSLEPGAAETVVTKNVIAQRSVSSEPQSRDGVARFTVDAVNFADVASQAKQHPAFAELSEREAAKPETEPVKVVTTTRLEVKAGDQVAIPIKLSPALGTGEVAAIVLRGLPKDYSVVAAMPSGDGSWVMSPDALGAARITVPQAATGEVNLTAELFDISARVVGTPRFVLDVAPEKVAGKPDAQQARDMLARGHDRLRAGDVAQARSLFKLAAERGVPEGAYALGETFDPVKLRAGGAGQMSDRAQARFWYEYASQRGVVAARDRLAALNSGT